MNTLQLKCKIAAGLGLTFLFTAFFTNAQTTNVALGVPTGSIRTDTYPGAGYSFYTPTSGTTINQLGFWDQSGTGLAIAHTVSLYMYNGGNPSYTLIATTNIPAGTAAPLINNYRWISIPSLTLANIGQNGGYYVVMASQGTDSWSNDGLGTMNPLIGTVSGRALLSGGNGDTITTSPVNDNGNSDPSSTYGGPNIAFFSAAPAVPAPVLVQDIQPASATVGIGDKTAFTVAFSNSPPAILQWQVIANGVTNNVNTGVVTVTNNGVLTSTLTLTNLQLVNSASYQLEAVNATNSAGVTFSSAASLTVVSPIQWIQNGTFTDNTVLTLAGSAANEVYGVDFGAGDETTANGYSFTDAWTGSSVTGNIGITGTVNQYSEYLFSGTTGDGLFDSVITSGLYGSTNNIGTLSNLTVGQSYNIIVVGCDTRTFGSPQFGQDPETYFRATDGAFVSRNQAFSFPQGTNTLTGAPAIGGYLLGKFTAQSANQPLTIVSAGTQGSFINVQYGGILLVTSTPPVLPPLYLAQDTLPAYNARTDGSQPSPVFAVQGSNIVFTAAFHNIPAVALQWQVVSTNGVTNSLSTGVINVTNNSIVSSTLTLSNLQLSASGSSYQLEAINATNSADVSYSSPVPIAVRSTITWRATGTYSNNTVLALVGNISNMVYGVDFGAGAQTTANGYVFGDYTSGNISIAGSLGIYGGYLTGGATTGDAAMDAISTSGGYGSSANTGTLNNLTVGQTYNVLVLLDDTRGSAAGPSTTFTVTDGITTSPSQQFEFANGTPSVGGYILGTFTATATTQALTVQDGGSSQYNAILLAKYAAVSPTAPTFGAVKVSGGNLILTGTGGTPNSSYTVLTTTNLLIPVINWKTNTTGTLNGAGSFSNSIPINLAQPAAFYRLRLP